MTVLCLIEIDANGVTDSSLRALAFATSLTASADHDRADFSADSPEKSTRSWSDLTAVWFGPVTAASHPDLAAAGVSRAYAIGSDELSGYAPLAWARALASLASGLAGSPGSSRSPGSPGSLGSSGSSGSPGLAAAGAVVAASTDRGNEVMAHLAALTGLPMAANCVSAVRTAPDEVRLVRQRWAGSLLEDAVLTGSPALLTVAVDAVTAEVEPDSPAPSAQDSAVPESAVRDPVAPVPVGSEPTGPAVAGPERLSVDLYEPELAPGDLAVSAVESAERAGGVSLATARVVVGGGRGVGGPDGFATLEELAGLLGAAVGVSRVVTSEGWRPHRQQVGQTGTRIAPELYLACGISGAIQHMAGCQSAKNIVAINTDPGAPIVARADYAVIGDLHQIIPALVAALRARAAGA